MVPLVILKPDAYSFDFVPSTGAKLKSGANEMKSRYPCSTLRRDLRLPVVDQRVLGEEPGQRCP
jgi:hypothetical protein